MSDSEIQVHNMADAIREKIRNTIFDAIPDIQIDKLIQKEFEAYFEPRKKEGYNASGHHDSHFKQLVQECVQAQMKVRVVDMITKQINELTSQWDGNNHKLIGDLVDKMAPIAWISIQKNISEAVTRNLLNEFQNTMQNNQF